MSTEPTTEMMNEVIARFMGGTRIQHPEQKFFSEDHFGYICHKGHWWNERNLQYHTSWEWLMPVVEKIEKLENGRFGFTIDPWGIDIIDYLGAFEGRGETVIINVNREPAESTLLNDYYDTVYQFITWYNQQKQTNGCPSEF